MWKSLSVCSLTKAEGIVGNWGSKVCTEVGKSQSVCSLTIVGKNWACTEVGKSPSICSLTKGRRCSWELWCCIMTSLLCIAHVHCAYQSCSLPCCEQECVLVLYRKSGLIREQIPL